MAKILAFIAGIAVLAAVFFGLQNREFANQFARTKMQVRETVTSILPQATLPPSPTAKVLTGGTQTFQTFNNCGPASLSMTLSYFGINESQHTLGDALRPYQVASGDNDDKSTTLQEMAKKAQEYGFNVYYRPGGNIETIRAFINQGLPVIARTWLKTGEDIGHYRVIKGYDGDRQKIIQDDSLQGANLEFSYDDFYKLWEAFNYEYLVLVPKEKEEMAKVILGQNLNEDIAWENALVSADEAIVKEPDNVYPKFNKLVALYRLGRYQEAVEIYEAISDKLPRRMLWYQIEPILAYQKVGNYSRVFEITDNLINNGNRAFSEAYQIRGEVYEAQGKIQEAKAEFEKVKIYNKNFFKYWQ